MSGFPMGSQRGIPGVNPLPQFPANIQIDIRLIQDHVARQGVLQGWQAQVANFRFQRINELATNAALFLLARNQPEGMSEAPVKMAINFETQALIQSTSADEYERKIRSQNEFFKQQRMNLSAQQLPANTMNPSAPSQGFQRPFNQNPSAPMHNMTPNANFNQQMQGFAPNAMGRPFPQSQPTPQPFMHQPGQIQPQQGPPPQMGQHNSQGPVAALASRHYHQALQQCQQDRGRLEQLISAQLGPNQINQLRQRQTDPVVWFFMSKANDDIKRMGENASQQPNRPGMPPSNQPGQVQRSAGPGQTPNSRPLNQGIQAQPGIDFSLFNIQQQHARKSQEQGDLVVPASDNKPFGGNMPGLPGSSGPPSGQQMNGIPPGHFAGPNQLAHSQAQAHAQNQLQQRTPAQMAGQGPKQPPLTGQPGGLHVTQNQPPQQSPSIHTLNQPFNPPGSQASRTPQNPNASMMQPPTQPSPHPNMASMHQGASAGPQANAEQARNQGQNNASQAEAQQLLSDPRVRQRLMSLPPHQQQPAFLRMLAMRRAQNSSQPPSNSGLAQNDMRPTNQPSISQQNLGRPMGQMNQPANAPGPTSGPASTARSVGNTSQNSQRPMNAQQAQKMAVMNRLEIPRDFVMKAFNHQPPFPLGFNNWGSLFQWINQNPGRVNPADTAKLRQIQQQFVSFVATNKPAELQRIVGELQAANSTMKQNPANQPVAQGVTQPNRMALQANPAIQQYLRQSVVEFNAQGILVLKPPRPEELALRRQNLPPQAPVQPDSVLSNAIMTDRLRHINSQNPQIGRLLFRNSQMQQPQGQPPAVGSRNTRPMGPGRSGNNAMPPNQTSAANSVPVPNAPPLQSNMQPGSAPQLALTLNPQGMQPKPTAPPMSSMNKDGQLMRDNAMRSMASQQSQMGQAQSNGPQPSTFSAPAAPQNVPPLKALWNETEQIAHQIMREPLAPYTLQQREELERPILKFNENVGVFFSDVKDSYEMRPEHHNVHKDLFIAMNIALLQVNKSGQRPAVNFTISYAKVMTALKKLMSFRGAWQNMKRQRHAQAQQQYGPGAQPSSQPQQAFNSGPVAPQIQRQPQAEVVTEANSRPPPAQPPQAQPATPANKGPTKKSSLNKVQPTTAQPQMNHQRGDGAPIYPSPSSFDPSNMRVPQPGKRRKLSQQPKEDATAAAKAHPPEPEAPSQVNKELPHKATQPQAQLPQQDLPPPKVDLPFKCPIPGCEYETVGFDTQEKGDLHAKSRHQYDGNPLAFCLGALKKALNLEKTPQGMAALKNRRAVDNAKRASGSGVHPMKKEGPTPANDTPIMRATGSQQLSTPQMPTNVAKQTGPQSTPTSLAMKRSGSEMSKPGVFAPTPPSSKDNVANLVKDAAAARTAARGGLASNSKTEQSSNHWDTSIIKPNELATLFDCDEIRERCDCEFDKIQMPQALLDPLPDLDDNLTSSPEENIPTPDGQDVRSSGKTKAKIDIFGKYTEGDPFDKLLKEEPFLKDLPELWEDEDSQASLRGEKPRWMQNYWQKEGRLSGPEKLHRALRPLAVPMEEDRSEAERMVGWDVSGLPEEDRKNAAHSLPNGGSGGVPTSVDPANVTASTGGDQAFSFEDFIEPDAVAGSLAALFGEEGGEDDRGSPERMET